MADIDEVVGGLGRDPGFLPMALVPNGIGARRALAAGIESLIFVISMTDAHNLSNVRRQTADSIADLATVARDLGPAVDLRVGLASAFHCPFTGLVDEDVVMGNIERILRIRPGVEFAISDTTGMATPDHVGRLVRRAIGTFGTAARWCFHGHDTAGFGVANVLSALEAGITCFDAAAGGLGGCPFAPGATGNIATEDLVYLFDRMGVRTGVDLGLMLDTADYATSLPGAAPSGHARAIPRARLMPA